MEEKRIQYKSGDITVSYNPKLCIHAKECVKGLPSVFDINKKPWIDPGEAEPDKIAEVIHRCPTSALKYERSDGGQPETASSSAETVIKKNGPAYLTGEIIITNNDGKKIFEGTRAAICRCGASKNKPFCDNSHLEVEFNG